MAETTYLEEAKVIIDPITCEIPSIEVKTHGFPIVAFGLLGDIHPSGKYTQFQGSLFFFNVFVHGIEFTWFCDERFEEE